MPIPLKINPMGRVESGLPPQYRPLSYIESTGTQYLDTGIIVDSDLIIRYTFMITRIADIQRTRLIGRMTPAAERFALFGLYDQFILDWGNDSNQRIAVFGIVKTNGFYDMELGNLYIKDLTNNSLLAPGGKTPSFTDPDRTILLETEEPIPGQQTRIYRCIISKSRQVLCDLIPALRVSDNKPGLYDLARKQFFINSGTGEFLYE